MNTSEFNISNTPERQWQIEVTELNGEKSTGVITSGQTLTVGRSKNCNIRLSTVSVSRKHCQIIASHDRVEVRTHADASKPAKLNNRDIGKSESVVITDEDVLVLGDARLRITLMVSACDESTLPTRASKHVNADNTTESTRKHEPTSPGTEATNVLNLNRSEPTDSHADLTGYVPIEKIKNTLEGNKPKRMSTSKLLIISLMAVLLLVILFAPSGSNSPGSANVDGKDKNIYDGAFFVITPMSGWKCDTKGRTVLFSDSIFTKSRGIAITSIRKSECKWWSYSKALDELGRQAVEDTGILGKFKWDGDNTAIADISSKNLFRTGVSAIPYYYVMGHSDKAGYAAARIFLSFENAVGVFCWNTSGETGKAQADIMESFELKDIKSDLIMRCVVPDQSITQVSFQEVKLAIEEGLRWYEKRDVAPGNGWLSYQTLLKAYFWFCIGENHKVKAFADERDRTWNLLEESTQFLDDIFQQKKAQIMSSLQSGQADEVKRQVLQLQSQIPDRSDYRWIWAQRTVQKAKNTDTKEGPWL